MSRCIRGAGAALSVAILSCVSAGIASAAESAGDKPQHPLGVGLRRSSYGLRKRNADDAWWVARAKKFAAQFPGATPTIVQIVSNYQDDGSTQLEFVKPAGDDGPTSGISFQPGKLDHERALTLYDAEGVQAIVQFEPGNADVGRCLELAHRAFGKHPSIIGYGIDAEWYYSKETADDPEGAGRAIPDAAVRGWMEQTLSFNRSYVFFVKHWKPSQLPPTYRHPQLFYLQDGQKFRNQQEWLSEIREFADFDARAVVGVQYGYKSDQKWWSTLANPPHELGEALLKQIPSCRYLLWVDFTADRVTFDGAEK